MTKLYMPQLYECNPLSEAIHNSGSGLKDSAVNYYTVILQVHNSHQHEARARASDKYPQEVQEDQRLLAL